MTTTLEQLFGARTTTVVPGVVDPTTAADLRRRFEQAGYARYGLLDRGSYDVLRDPAEPALIGRLVELARTQSGRALVATEARVLRLRPGDYLLAHHDPPRDGLPLELVLDLSPSGVPGAEVHYRRRGQVFFRVPTTPGALAIVERGPAITCNHTYVSKLHASAEVVRLMLLLRDATA